ncbi:hypothetical protein M1146_04090 [Patescibacteria group bacterium]|nr:hypothetical protein [Patescibacteria group bacterium]
MANNDSKTTVAEEEPWVDQTKAFALAMGFNIGYTTIIIQEGTKINNNTCVDNCDLSIAIIALSGIVIGLAIFNTSIQKWFPSNSNTQPYSGRLTEALSHITFILNGCIAIAITILVAINK